MSETAVLDFFKTSLTKPALLAEVTSTTEGLSEVEAGEAVAALGAREGYTFTGEQALVVRERFLDRLNDAEGDEVLQGVSGGNGGDEAAQIQVGVLADTLGMIGPTGTGMILNMVGSAAVAGATGGDAGQALVSSATQAASGLEAIGNWFRSW